MVRRCRFGEHADDDPSGRLPRPKRASAVKDRENLGRVPPETIHDSVAVHDYLPKRWLPNLGNDAAGAWVVLEAADGRDDSFDDQVRVISRIAGEVSPDGVHVFERLRRPDDPGHRRRRRLTSP